MLYYSEKSIGFPSIIFPLDDLEKIREVVTYSIKNLYFFIIIYIRFMTFLKGHYAKANPRPRAHGTFFIL